MEEPKENKKVEPAQNKQVRIKMKPGRAATGVTTDPNGYAMVDSKTADYLIEIGYATLAKEK